MTHLNLYIDEKTDHIYDESGAIVGEQRGKQVKLLPFENAPFIVNGFPEGWKLDAEEWLVLVDGETQDAAMVRQYYECYFGLFVVPIDNNLRTNRCAIHLKTDYYNSIEANQSLTISLKKR